MKKLILLLLASSAGLFLGGCVFEEGYTGVSVSHGGYYPGYYDDGYRSEIEYYDDGPYYLYSGRRYYSSGGRYRYYQGGNPVYVTSLPYGARYISSKQRSQNYATVNRYKYQQEQAKRNYEAQQNQYRYTAKTQQYQSQAKVSQYRAQQTQQQWASQQKVNQYQAQQKQKQWQSQQAAQQYKYQQAAAAAKYKKKKNDD